MFRRTTSRGGIAPRNTWRAVAALGAAALMLGACADGNGEEPEEPSGETFEGTFTLGGLMPTRGALAEFGVGIIAAAEMAVEEVNQAGGVWGSDVVWVHQDEGPPEEADVAAAAGDALIAQGVNAIIGGVGSDPSLAVIEAMFNQKILMVSPSNTGAAFTGHQFGEYYFRTAPSDLLQGSALAELIINDEFATLGILGQQTTYGEGLADEIDSVYTAAGGEVLYKEFYDLAQTEYSAEIAALVQADPDAFVLVSYDEAVQIIPQLIGAGFTPADKQWYFVDGSKLDYSEHFDEEGLLEGVKATTPAGGGEEPTELLEQVDEFAGGIPQTVYVPESYDAVIVVTLAAIAANSDDPDAIKDQMVPITTGGTKCATFAECKDLLDAGEDIDYDGYTAVEWNDNGEPAQATIGIFEYLADNSFEQVDSVTGRM